MDEKTLVHRWFDEVWNRGREDMIDELFSPQVAYGLGEGDPAVRGPAGFKIFWRNMRSALPDVDIRIEDTVVQRDKAVVRAQRDYAFVRLRPDEAPALQPFGEQTQPVAIPPEHFDQIAAFAAKHEHVTRVRVLFEHRLRGGAQAGEAAVHVRHAGSNPDVRVRRQRAHRPTCSRMVRKLPQSTDPSTRIRTRPTSI